MHRCPLFLSCSNLYQAKLIIHATYPRPHRCIAFQFKAMTLSSQANDKVSELYERVRLVTAGEKALREVSVIICYSPRFLFLMTRNDDRRLLTAYLTLLPPTFSGGQAY